MIKAGRGPNLTTTEDMAKLLNLIYSGKIKGSAELLDIMNEEQDRRRMPLYLPDDIKVAHKTGSLNDGLHDVGIVFAKNPFIFCFMSDDLTDKVAATMICAECAKLCFDFSSSK
jgi:beta-lactamase class A